MNYEIKWLQEAEATAAQNMDYLIKEWDSKVLYQFLTQVENALIKIKHNPHSYPLHLSAKGVRKYSVNKRIVLYYRVIDDSVIELLTFWNTYRDPEDLNFE